ncbi:hypothetical protein [Paenibacillus thermotolerans]|uniref:hypothetical protein n=1 Tax=Paenibacillus thermotolerans TaxID=3027807 RepID=UPI002368188E|nr:MULTISPECIES: hypothetical protein [unclassified Paenibacillus]
MLRGKFIMMTLLALCMLALLSGCGGGPKADVSVFIITKAPLDMEKTDGMKAALQERMGENTVDVAVSPMFSIEKLIVELAAGGHGILIVDEEQFKAFANQGAFYSLEDTFDPAEYPEGVIDMTIKKGDTEQVVNGLYGMPVDRTDWLQSGGYAGGRAYAFIPLNAPNPELAKQALKAIVEWKAQN